MSTYVLRAPRLDDADDLGRVHVRAWQRAYAGGLMPDDYLDSLDVGERSAMWREALGRDARPRSARIVAVAVTEAETEAEDGVLVGFVLVGPAGGDPDADVGELYAINVDPERWGTGAGAALLAAGVEALTETGFGTAILWVHPGNARARAFYEAHGWTDDGIERDQEVIDVTVPEVRYSIRLPVADRDAGRWLTEHRDEENCYLTSTGRRTGNPHEIEIWFGVDGGTLYLISGNGPTADWYRNLVADPVVTVRIACETHVGRARVIDDPAERRRCGELMGTKYVWGGDPDIGLTYEAWCFDVPAVAVEF